MNEEMSPLELVARQRYDRISRQIEKAIQRVASRYRAQQGALPELKKYYHIGDWAADPPMGRIEYVFTTHAAQQQADREGICANLRAETLQALAAENFPAQSIARLEVAFTNEERMSDEVDGMNYYK